MRQDEDKSGQDAVHHRSLYRDHAGMDGGRDLARLGVSTSTGYRYIRELASAGLLIRITGGAYVLGARIIQLEMLMRTIDPISRLGRAIILPMVKQTGATRCSPTSMGSRSSMSCMNAVRKTSTLRSFAGDRCRSSRARRQRPSSPFCRGRAWRACTMRTPAKSRQPAWANPGRSSGEPSGHPGHADISESRGELDPDITGFGVPVFNGNEVLGSVVLACSTERVAILNRAR